MSSELVPESIHSCPQTRTFAGSWTAPCSARKAAPLFVRAAAAWPRACPGRTVLRLVKAGHRRRRDPLARPGLHTTSLAATAQDKERGPELYFAFRAWLGPCSYVFLSPFCWDAPAQLHGLGIVSIDNRRVQGGSGRTYKRSHRSVCIRVLLGGSKEVCLAHKYL